MNIFESPIFMITVILIGTIIVGSILLINILFNISGNEENISDIKLFTSKIIYSIEYFEEFSLSIFIVMIGAYLYYYIDNSIRIVKIVKIIFNQYSSIIQIGIIIISIICMNYLSNKFEHCIPKEEKTSLRLLGSMYSVINLILIRIIINEKGLDTTIICYIGLILGRFVFFDTSIETICLEFKKIGKKIVLLPIMGIIVFIMILIYRKNGIDIKHDNILLQFVLIYFAMVFGLKMARKINTNLFL